ncbi:hypothetical protein I204_07298 [Kwoniella mangroviensis CBS 8886]|uniref:hypothetical protein n=1 Tax=Kwoniella mangroviensis CBS 8507 TaxID=1296122 RepID=UPI00080D30D0|nr:uncharacterized protein I203_04911 [Kwoniella mangroviensis CBS 8507]OCF65891.1 hypothetical protein I203_04911 [Kwoniella mangroviensis CBS 8507]OCF72034.1 hypothetical protein I204_07298 [Kwoniella mangroviensis CBS 8886]
MPNSTTVYEYEPEGRRPSDTETPPYSLIRDLAKAVHDVLYCDVAVQYYTRGEGSDLSFYLMFIKNGSDDEWSTHDRRELEKVLGKKLASYEHANTY